jgi:hypothetical protein
MIIVFLSTFTWRSRTVFSLASFSRATFRCLRTMPLKMLFAVRLGAAFIKKLARWKK